SDEGEVLGSKSAVAHNLRSIIAAPLLLRDAALGVVYLDSRLAKGIFTRDDVSVLGAICNHVAIAFETSRIANVELEKKAFEKDIALAATVQTLFLPKSDTLRDEHVSLSGYYLPA